MLIGERGLDLECVSCGLYKGCKSYNIGLWGEGRKGILVVGEAPGREEDEVGRPFVGRSGQFLRRVLEGFEVDLDRDCWVLNVVRCRPTDGRGGDRVPSDREVKMCSKFFDRDFRRVLEFGCRLVLLFGSVACKKVLGSGNVSLLRGRVIPDLRYGVWVGVSYHPAVVLRGRDVDGYIEKLFVRDVGRALEVSRGRIVDVLKRLRWEVVSSEEQVGEMFELIYEKGYCVVDIETVGLRPYGDGSRVLCIGVGVGDRVWVIDCDRWDGDKVRGWLQVILEDERVVKVFHNAGMELEWFKVKYGLEVRNFDDTLLMSYLLDEREGAHDLKFLAWVEFGVRGYDEYVKRFYSDLSRVNREEVWRYNAVDVFVTGRLWRLYRDVVLRRFGWLYREMLLKALKVFNEMSVRGCEIDFSYLSKLEDEYVKKIQSLKDEMRVISAKFGMMSLNFNSVQQLGELLYKRMGLPVLKTTRKSGMWSVDVGVLEDLIDGGYDKYGFIEKLLEYKKYVKLKSTYIDGIRDLVVGGKVHPRYYLHTTVTGRTSCSDPNMQNIPKRGIGIEVRGVFCVEDGYVFLANDYSQWEVRVVQMYANDDELGRVIREGIDIHAYYTELLTGLKETDGEEFRRARQDVKGGFTFASIYGAGVKTIVRSLWKRWLSKRFRDMEVAEKFVREVQEEFFRRFRGVREWQLDLMRFYERYGYIETLFGRRRRAPIKYTQIINTPVQSVASDFTLLSMVRVYEELGLVPFVMIHDDLTYVVREDEVVDIAKEIRRCMTEWDFDFVNVPIEVEQKVGKRWDQLVELKYE